MPAGRGRALDGVDLILHGGDVCLRETLEELEQYAPVRAVLGNNDGPDVAAWGAPETLRLELDGLRVAMLHDSGPADRARAARLRRLFPDAALVVFGHSHIPWDEALRRPASLQSRLADRQAPPAARHDGRAGHRPRRAGLGADLPGHLIDSSRT